MTVSTHAFNQYDAGAIQDPRPVPASLAEVLANDRLAAAVQDAFRSVQVSSGIVVFAPGVPSFPNRSYIVSNDGCQRSRAICAAIADRMAAAVGPYAATEAIQQYFELDIAQHGASGASASDQATFTMKTAEAGGLVALLQTKSSGPDWREDVAQRLQIVAPLLIELAGAERAKQRAARHLGLLEGALDEMSVALFLLDAHSRPFCLNAAALGRLAMADAFQLTRTGILSCSTARDTLALHNCVKRVIEAPPGDLDEEPLVISTRDGERTMATLRGVGADGFGLDNRAALLMIQHEVRLSRAALDGLGLTTSERRFLTTFLYCSSLASTAKRLNLSDETARTYLKRICAKLGVRKQAELVSLIWNLSLPLRRKPDVSDGAAPGALGRLGYCKSPTS